MDMKKIIITVISLMCSFAMSAQERTYGRFDFEAGFEVPLLAASHSEKTNGIVPGFHIEGRWQLEMQPIDVGFHVGLSVIKRKFDSDHENYRTVPIMAVADYQFGRGKKFNPYVGLGAGVSMNTIVNHAGSDKPSFIIAPRIGIRCFKFLNIAIGYQFTQKDYSRLYCNIGFYF